VAGALAGRATAEQVALQRFRSNLGKSTCENLRELEHPLATLAAQVPQGWVAGA
jgi:hypothetical protein